MGDEVDRAVNADLLVDGLLGGTGGESIGGGDGGITFDDDDVGPLGDCRFATGTSFFVFGSIFSHPFFTDGSLQYHFRCASK